MSTIFTQKSNHYLFTSESVGEGHPDKICDQISDAVLDECMKSDVESGTKSHVACETFTTTGMVLVGGEISTNANLDIQKIARNVAKKIGYTNADYGLDCDSMAVLNTIHTQSPDINQGVVTGGAGDQGMMFGFACNETSELMPAPIMFSHKLMKKASEIRKSGNFNWLRPDAKSQVTIEYEGNTPVHIDTVVLSHQHDGNISNEEIHAVIKNEIIKPVLEQTGIFDEKTKIFINPTGKFEIGGPQGDAGLTGRKIIVDTYGGMGRHGGGAFSGKDPTKVDRSAAYMARYIAKNIVAADFAQRAEVQLAYAIGIAEPVSIMVKTFGTEKIPEEKIVNAVKKIFDCTPEGIIQTLKLRAPIYSPTAAYGHFGRKPYSENGFEFFTWEKTDKIEELKNSIK